MEIRNNYVNTEADSLFLQTIGLGGNVFILTLIVFFRLFVFVVIFFFFYYVHLFLINVSIKQI